ncbi:DUF805 domain-containing protein [Parvibaculum sp.]|uniref:DUF805 domain-containing protein n=1 Tax=Parvibaculum TaxID=256616 RepID=UPI000C8FD7EC|nr:DUF805 domain-containing protein [Parvibaculum sp.]MAB12701.1 hypothetical protein [Parvibaculum sp.]NIJ41556.1 uncharacterized membrane protein YhaH (DUF805 family) [Parvibaculum indicum]
MDEFRTHIFELLSMRGRRSRASFVLTIGAATMAAGFALSLVLSTAIWEIANVGFDVFGWAGMALLPISYIFASICVQRLHDIGLNGLWFVPAVGAVAVMPDLALMFLVFAIALVALMVTPGTPGANRYGRNRFPYPNAP